MKTWQQKNPSSLVVKWRQSRRHDPCLFGVDSEKLGGEGGGMRWPNVYSAARQWWSKQPSVCRMEGHWLAWQQSLMFLVLTYLKLVK